MADQTDVTVLSPKQELIEGKAKYDTYSKWGMLPTGHSGGAYIGYQMLMDAINSNHKDRYRVLQESDYQITVVDQGVTLFGGIHKEGMLENFQITDPKAQLTNEKLTLYGEDQRHRFYTNEGVGNKTRLLVLGDSYFETFIMDDLAESFYVTIMIWGDYASELEQIVEEYQPDIIVMENAERCDRTDGFAMAMLEMREESY